MEVFIFLFLFWGQLWFCFRLVTISIFRFFNFSYFYWIIFNFNCQWFWIFFFWISKTMRYKNIIIVQTIKKRRRTKYHSTNLLLPASNAKINFLKLKAARIPNIRSNKKINLIALIINRNIVIITSHPILLAYCIYCQCARIVQIYLFDFLLLLGWEWWFTLFKGRR